MSIKEALEEASKKLELHKDDAKYLASVYPVLDEVEAWCKAVREAVNAMLNQGKAVPGYKLVAGKEGNRAWGDEAALRRTLIAAQLAPELYTDTKIKSVAQLEKAIKKGYPDVWQQCESLVVRPEGRPSVAPESDPRPAIGSVADDFDDLSLL